MIPDQTRETKVLLVRHGESDWNARGLIQGHSDVPVLTERGRRQARAVALKLLDFDIDHIVSSDQGRAQETAAIIGAALDLEFTTTSALRERSFGLLEGEPQEAMDPRSIGLEDGRIANTKIAIEGGESFADIYGRVLQWAEGSLPSLRTGNVVIVAHGGSIRMLRAHLSGISLDGMAWGEVSNASVIDVTPSNSLMSAIPH